MNEVDDLLARVGADRSVEMRADGLFSGWWRVRDERAHELLDRLAVDASTNTDALDLLLTLVDRHGLARPALRRLLISEQDLADAEQATLAVVAMKVGQYRHGAHLVTWLHQVATNEAKMLIRSRERRPSSAVAEPPVAPFVARLSTMLADRDAVERALGALSDDSRDVLELREIEGLEYEEIAVRLGVPVGTVRSRLSRGRSQLVELLRAEMVEATDDAAEPDDACDRSVESD